MLFAQRNEEYKFHEHRFFLFFGFLVYKLGCRYQILQQNFFPVSPSHRFRLVGRRLAPSCRVKLCTMQHYRVLVWTHNMALPELHRAFANLKIENAMCRHVVYFLQLHTGETIVLGLTTSWHRKGEKSAV